MKHPFLLGLLLSSPLCAVAACSSSSLPDDPFDLPDGSLVIDLFPDGGADAGRASPSSSVAPEGGEGGASAPPTGTNDQTGDDGSDGGDSGPAGEGGVSDGGSSSSCAAVVAAHLGAAIVPPTSFAGFTYQPSPDAGVTVVQLDPDHCYPAVGEADPEPGFETYGSSGVQLFGNLDTDEVYLLEADETFKGALTWDTPLNSQFGPHHYVAKIGSVTRDGIPIVIDWSFTSESFQELYVGLLAAFAPEAAPSTNCVEDGSCLVSAQAGVFGVRAPLYIYFTFAAGTSRPIQFYTYNMNAKATCATPKSFAEQALYAYILPKGYATIGGLTLAGLDGVSALASSDANDQECDTGIPGPSSGGLDTIDWGQGTFGLAYDPTAKTGLKLAATAGYKGSFYTYTADGKHHYEVGVGYFHYDDADVDILGGGAPAVTAFANAARQDWYGYAPSKDCLVDGTCKYTYDTAGGTTTLTLPDMGLAFVFDTSSHQVVEIDAIATRAPRGF